MNTRSPRLPRGSRFRRSAGATVAARAVAAVALPLLVAGCFGLRPTPTPVETLTLAEGTDPDCLLILLPGRGDRPQRYAEHDFPAIARRNGIEARIVSPDLHMGYYRDKVVDRRLEEDLVGPALEADQRVWLAGISLGGLGSLLSMAKSPGQVEGVVLLSPFLGEGAVLDEIEAAGSLEAWEPPELDPERTEPPEGQETWQRLWGFLRQTVANPDAPPIYLAYGSDDRLARSHRLLARELPADRVIEIDGGHDWDTWEALWRQVTEVAPICR